MLDEAPEVLGIPASDLFGGLGDVGGEPENELDGARIVHLGRTFPGKSRTIRENGVFHLGPASVGRDREFICPARRPAH
jgi:hypothetical protein